MSHVDVVFSCGISGDYQNEVEDSFKNNDFVRIISALQEALKLALCTLFSTVPSTADYRRPKFLVAFFTYLSSKTKLSTPRYMSL